MYMYCMLDKILVLCCTGKIRKILFEDADNRETWRQITGVVVFQYIVNDVDVPMMYV